MEVIPSSGLSDAEIDEMVEEAERHREEDRRRQENVRTRNQADAVIYSAQRFLREQGDRIPSDVRSDVEGKLETVQSALGGDDYGTIQRRTEELRQAIHQAGSTLYEGAPGPDTAHDTAPPPSEGSGDSESRDEEEDIIEGDFSEV
jgi:molecular chaperone DnaK